MGRRARSTCDPHPGEVLAAYRVGLHQLSRADSPRFIDIPESDRPVVQVPLGNDLIHAPTGAVLVQFRWLGLEGRDDPVAGFEQPVFAWTLSGQRPEWPKPPPRSTPSSSSTTLPGDLLDALHDELGDAVAAVDAGSRPSGRC